MNFSPFGYGQLFQWLENSSLSHWLECVPQLVEQNWLLTVTSRAGSRQWLNSQS